MKDVYLTIVILVMVVIHTAIYTYTIQGLMLQYQTPQLKTVQPTEFIYLQVIILLLVTVSFKITHLTGLIAIIQPEITQNPL